VPNIIICAHKYLTQPDDELVLYLNQRKSGELLMIHHSFADASDRSSRCVWYKEGMVHKACETADYQWLPESLIYAKELICTMKWVLTTRTKWDVYIGMDGLCVLFGNITRFFGSVQKTIYWAIDFVPEHRFKSCIKNFIYHWINVRGYRNADELWDLSPRMAAAREKYLGIRINDYRLHKVVPYGAWTKRIKKYRYNECQKNTLVFMGHLIEKQGVQLVIKAIPEIIKTMPEFKFKIIGEGSYRNELEKLSSTLNVSAYCDFRGKINDILELEKEIARSCAGIAPYVKALDTWTYYADPGKVKTYLACGAPVLLTDIPWNAMEIEKAGCGKIISEEISDIVAGILELMDPKNNQNYRDCAVRYSMGFDYTSIFDTLACEWEKDCASE